MKKRILFVDDDKDFVESLSERLEAEGFEVIPAYDGNQAWEKIRTEGLDLIILDVMMPGKDGFQLCAEIKADKKWRELPVVLLTAVGDYIPKTKYSIADGLNIEAEDYIPKPVKIEELLKSIKNLL